MKCVSLARPWFWGLRGTNIDCVESWQTYLFFIFKPANILLLPIPEWWQGRVVMSICGRVIWLVVSNIWLVVSKFAVFFSPETHGKKGRPNSDQRWIYFMGLARWAHTQTNNAPFLNLSSDLESQNDLRKVPTLSLSIYVYIPIPKITLQ